MTRLALALALAVSGAPLRVEVDAEQIDPDAARTGLELRLGDAADDWVVVVHGTDATDRADVRLRAPDGAQMQRWVSIEGSTVEERTRELASAIALIIEGYRSPKPTPEPKPEPGPEPQPQPKPEPIRGWVGAGPRIGVGPLSAPDLDLGIDVRGGAWLVHEIVQPLADVGWSRSIDGALILDGIRFGVGAAFGSALATGRLWLGGSVLPRAAWTRAQDQRAVSKWRSSTELAALLQIRGRWWMLGLRVGADLTFPPVRARGQDLDDELRWGPVRFATGLDLGLVLPWGAANARN